MSGEMIVHDSNAIIRGACDAVEGSFSGKLATDALDIVSTAKIRGGAISRNRVLNLGSHRQSVSFTVPPTPHATAVEIVIPYVIESEVYTLFHLAPDSRIRHLSWVSTDFYSAIYRTRGDGEEILLGERTEEMESGYCVSRGIKVLDTDPSIREIPVHYRAELDFQKGSVPTARGHYRVDNHFTGMVYIQARLR